MKDDQPNQNIKKHIQEINDIAEQTYYLEQQKYKIDKQIKANKDKISQAMGTKKTANFKVDKYLAFRVTKQVETDIQFYPDRLKKLLSKEHYKNIVDKEHTINDLKGLVKLLKLYGVSPTEFKNFVDTKEEVNINNLDTLLSLGDLEIADIHDCYNIKFEDHIKVSKAR